MLVALCAVFLVICVIAAFKESKITGKYAALGIYGRVKAYLAFAFLCGSVCTIIVPLATGEQVEMSQILTGLFFLAIGVLIYVLTYLKTPPEYKKTVIPCMIITAMGVSLKMALFYLPFIWQLAAYDTPTNFEMPELVRDENGNMCRTRIDGSFVYIQRPDGSEKCIPLDDIKSNIEDNDNLIRYKGEDFYIR
jgi:hypothetical protein